MAWKGGCNSLNDLILLGKLTLKLSDVALYVRRRILPLSLKIQNSTHSPHYPFKKGSKDLLKTLIQVMELLQLSRRVRRHLRVMSVHRMALFKHHRVDI